MKVIFHESGFGRKCFWTKVFLDEFFSNVDESVPNLVSHLTFHPMHLHWLKA